MREGHTSNIGAHCQASLRCDLITVAAIIYASVFALRTERDIVILRAEELIQNHFYLTLRT